ncbi:DUF2924 domain-containing protein [Magnetococcales bacterium HHB-1]
MSKVLKKVAILPSMSIQELREMWRELYDADPPSFTKTFLIKRLAYRLQELTYNGLQKKELKRLQHLAEENRDETSRAYRSQNGRPLPGTRLIREWKGVEHCCTVLEKDFEYQGQKFKSLSAVARHITGTRWNGLVFWGLKR